MARLAELMRGLVHQEIDQGWILSEMEKYSQQVYYSAQALHHRYQVEEQSKIRYP